MPPTWRTRQDNRFQSTEMGMPSEQAVIDKLATLPEYPAAFGRRFGAEPALSYANLREAIAAFERACVRTESRFDDFARRWLGTSEQEQRGLKSFVKRQLRTLPRRPIGRRHCTKRSASRHRSTNQKDQGASR